MIVSAWGARYHRETLCTAGRSVKTEKPCICRSIDVDRHLIRLVEQQDQYTVAQLAGINSLSNLVTYCVGALTSKFNSYQS
jgi:hypothetical protein